MTQQIRTERLVLRPLVESDAPRAVELLNDYAVSKWLARVPHPFRSEDLRILDEEGASRWPDLAGICHNGRLIGALSLRAEHLGYWLGADFWRNGFGAEAATAAVDYIKKLGAREIISAVFEGNIASQRILTGLGFRETGRDLAPCLAWGEDIPNVNYCLTLSELGARS